MALATYADLLTDVPLWLARPGDTTRLTAANVADLVTLCEARIAYGSGQGSPFPSPALRLRAMETQRTLVIKLPVTPTAVGGTANAITFTLSSTPSANALGDTYSFTAALTNTAAVTVNTGVGGAVAIKKGSALDALEASDLIAGGTYTLYFDGTYFVLLPGRGACPLPPNYLAMRTLYIDTSQYRRALEYVTPQQMNDLYAGQQTSEPFKFTIEADCIRMGPGADQAYYLPCQYYKKFAALVTASTNWLMTNKPDIYLFGSLLEAVSFLGHDERMPIWHGQFLGACSGLQDADSMDRHSGSPLLMRTATGNP